MGWDSQAVESVSSRSYLGQEKKLELELESTSWRGSLRERTFSMCRAAYEGWPVITNFNDLEHQVYFVIDVSSWSIFKINTIEFTLTLIIIERQIRIERV